MKQVKISELPAKKVARRIKNFLTKSVYGLNGLPIFAVCKKQENVRPYHNCFSGHFQFVYDTGLVWPFKISGAEMVQ